ncbi:hypothetical protein DRO55_05495 [Candidatus Bathyarchaeota archaeon]|nr:MAG: hypothetical protein DRO55_05495 [Candidatus Bathyarchaeota archaeon]
MFLSATSQIECWSRSRRNGEVTIVERVIETPKGPITSISVRREGFPSRVVKGWIETDEDLDRFLSIPYEPPRPDLGFFFEEERRIGYRAGMSLNAPEPIGVVAPLFLWERFVKRVYRDKETILQLTEIIFERAYDFLRYILSKGVKAIFWLIGPEYVAPPLFHPRFFEEFVVNFDSKLVKLIHEYGSKAIIHCHGRVNMILEHLASIGIDGLHPVEQPPLGDTPLKEAKRRIGDRVCIVGNIDIGDILTSSSEEMERKVKKAIREGGPDGLILSTTASPHWWPLPERAYQNYVRFVETARRYGRGPVRIG